MCVCYDVSGRESMAYVWLADATLPTKRLNFHLERWIRIGVLSSSGLSVTVVCCSTFTFKFTPFEGKKWIRPDLDGAFDFIESLLIRGVAVCRMYGFEFGKRMIRSASVRMEYVFSLFLGEKSELVTWLFGLMNVVFLFRVSWTLLGETQPRPQRWRPKSDFTISKPLGSFWIRWRLKSQSWSTPIRISGLQGVWWEFKWEPFKDLRSALSIR